MRYSRQLASIRGFSSPLVAALLPLFLFENFMITVSHPTVNQYVRALVTALDRHSELRELHTTIAIGQRSVGIARRKIRQHPYREILRLLGQRWQHDWLVRHESGLVTSLPFSRFSGIVR